MSKDPQPKGLHRRIDAQERHLAELENEMLALQASFASRSSEPERALAAADQLAAMQSDYDDAVRTLRELEGMVRRLRDWGLTPGGTASWAAVCRVLGLPSHGGAHRAVRSQEPVLHVLLHRCAFPSYCSLDGASYQ